MSSPTQIVNDAQPLPRFKMRLRQTEVMVTPTGTTRYPPGAVLIVDKDTAARWYENNVADVAPPDAEAYGEVSRRLKREEFERVAQPVEGSFNDIITRDAFYDDPNQRQLMPKPMPVPNRRGPGRPRKELEGADVLTMDADEE